MPNKLHTIIDDSVSFPYLDTAHVTRVGLILSTLESSKGVVLTPDDVTALLELNANPKDKLDKESFRKEVGNATIHFKGDGFTIALLIVPMEDTEEINCYPFSDNNKHKRFWPYDKHFSIQRLGTLEGILVTAKNTHPMASVEELDEKGVDHMTSISSVVLRFILGLQEKKFSLKEESVSYERINKKRQKNNKAAIKNDTKLEWV